MHRAIIYLSSPFLDSRSNPAGGSGQVYPTPTELHLNSPVLRNIRWFSVLNTFSTLQQPHIASVESASHFCALPMYFPFLPNHVCSHWCKLLARPPIQYTWRPGVWLPGTSAQSAALADTRATEFPLISGNFVGAGARL